MNARELVKELLKQPDRELEIVTYSCMCDCDDCQCCHYDTLHDNGEEVDLVGEYFTDISVVGKNVLSNGKEVIVIG